MINIDPILPTQSIYHYSIGVETCNELSLINYETHPSKISTLSNFYLNSTTLIKSTRSKVRKKFSKLF